MALRLRKEMVAHVVESLFAALFLTAVIYSGGTWAGRKIVEVQKDYRTERFYQAVEDQGLVIKMLSDEQIHAVTSKYIAALADAVVRFEFFPRNDDISIFFEVISAIPPELAVDKFEFSGRNLVVYCGAPAQKTLTQFSASLSRLEHFRDASLESYQKKDGSFYGTVTCVAV